MVHPTGQRYPRYGDAPNSHYRCSWFHKIIAVEALGAKVEGMCTRYTLHHRRAAVDTVARALGREFRVGDDVADFNVAPTRQVPVVAEGVEGEPGLREMLWGLLPDYERGDASAKLLPNARAETAGASRAFREAVAGRRCLVPANGFYEWRSVHGRKQPHLFTLKGGESFAFAGIWQPSGSGGVDTFAILTTRPNARVSPVHDRMPVILRGGSMPLWLGGRPLSADLYAALVEPLDAGLMEVSELGDYLNNPRHNGPECHGPAGDPGQMDLF